MCLKSILYNVTLDIRKKGKNQTIHPLKKENDALYVAHDMLSMSLTFADHFEALKGTVMHILRTQCVVEVYQRVGTPLPRSEP